MEVPSLVMEYYCITVNENIGILLWNFQGECWNIIVSLSKRILRCHYGTLRVDTRMLSTTVRENVGILLWQLQGQLLTIILSLKHNIGIILKKFQYK